MLAAEESVSRRRFLRAAVALGVGTTTGVGAHGYLYERHRIDVTRTDLPVSGLPVPLHGLRIGLITDLHHSRTVHRADLEEAVRLTLAERADLIVLGGDYVTWGDRRYVEPAAEALAPLTAPHGVFAILGNHDDDRDMPAALTARGFTVLKDARTRITIRNEPLELAGVRYWTRKVGDIAGLLRGVDAPTILLAHDPRRLTEAAALDVPLVLSGHTHGGQVVLPVIGAPARRRFPLLSGTMRQANTTIFVSRGVGTVYVPVRINCPPEVAILTLRRLSNI
jgi:predicted MPP superfamily phosphohydrolase